MTSCVNPNKRQGPGMSNEPKKSALFSTLSKILNRDSMRPVTRFLTDAHVFLYRLTGGKAQIAKYPTLLLTTKGRKTGKLRTIPLVYVTDRDRFIIAAAYAGSDRNPTWWLNLQQSREAVIQVMRTEIKVRAEVATPDERGDLWRKLVAMYPYFTDYQTRTTRQIPIVILKPVK